MGSTWGPHARSFNTITLCEGTITLVPIPNPNANNKTSPTPHVTLNPSIRNGQLDLVEFQTVFAVTQCFRLIEVAAIGGMARPDQGVRVHVYVYVYVQLSGRVKVCFMLRYGYF